MQAPQSSRLPLRFLRVYRFVDQDGYPATAPPWGNLTAVDLNTGKFIWRIPFGEYPELAEQGMKNTGSPEHRLGRCHGERLALDRCDPFDSKFHAYDTKTGKLIWETHTSLSRRRPAPATYMVNGRQYVAISTSGAAIPGARRARVLVVYALPQ